MKLRWISLLFAAFLLVAPVVSADDGSVVGVLQELIDQIVAIIAGDDEATADVLPSADHLEAGDLYPPHG